MGYRVGEMPMRAFIIVTLTSLQNAGMGAVGNGCGSLGALQHSIRKGPQLAPGPGLFIGCRFFNFEAMALGDFFGPSDAWGALRMERSPQGARIGLFPSGSGQMRLCSRSIRAETISVSAGSSENSTSHAQNHARRLPFKMAVNERESLGVGRYPSGLELLRCLEAPGRKDIVSQLHPHTWCIRMHHVCGWS